MKKFLFILIEVILVSGLLFSGCGEPADNTTTPATTPPAGTTPAEPSSPTPPDEGAVYGGTLRIVQNGLTNNIGYQPEWGSEEGTMAGYYAEYLAEHSFPEDSLTPCLAVSWDEDIAAKTLTVHLREGVKFHDGTDFDAEAVRWTVQQSIDAKNSSLWKYIVSMEVIDDYTIKFTFNDYPYTLTTSVLTGPAMLSPTAIETNGEEWARDNVAATGPFKVIKYQRDVSLTIEKFEGYWREGYPYLDKIVIEKIPDNMVARARMEAGQADYWEEMFDVIAVVEMQEEGFLVHQTGPVQLLLWYLYPDIDDPLFQDINIRRAIAAAIDTNGIAEGIGKGTYTPLRQLVGPGLNGYLDDYDANPYDPKLARQYLADAGHPDGFSTKLVYENTFQDIAVAIKSDLAKVGIIVELEAVTGGAFFPIFFGMGWEGLILGFSGLGNDLNCIASFESWLGPDRAVPVKEVFDWPQEVLDLMDQGLHTYDLTERAVLSKQFMRLINDLMYVIPVYGRGITAVGAPYVHHYHPAVKGNGIRLIYKAWMEKH